MKSFVFLQNFPKFDKHRAFNKAVGTGKSPKLINVGPTFIPDYRVMKAGFSEAINF